MSPALFVLQLSFDNNSLEKYFLKQRQSVQDGHQRPYMLTRARNRLYVHLDKMAPSQISVYEEGGFIS